ncbi:unnamed protein product [Protopolystoma xenopodis]|uniref:Uncharacterized protein n=1 Tax=Protopolystoma xenopodis TaxID=117903 RepID=A0A448X1Y6_9PLAT|nr:unnamed protein product [Protopolystoma xenopodis]
MTKGIIPLECVGVRLVHDRSAKDFAFELYPDTEKSDSVLPGSCTSNNSIGLGFGSGPNSGGLSVGNIIRSSKSDKEGFPMPE